MIHLEQRNARGEPQRYLLALALKFLLRDPPSKSLHFAILDCFGHS